jgi:hypothetical protein
MKIIKVEIPTSPYNTELLTYEDNVWLEELSKYKLLSVLELCIFYGAPDDVINKVKEELYKKSSKSGVIANDWKRWRTREINISPFFWI